MTAPDGDDHLVRPVRADEWRAVKELRLAALRDPVAHLAFLETYEQAAGRPDSFWQERAARSGAEGGEVCQFVAETGRGEWTGTVTVLIEDAGATDWAGYPVERRQGHIVGVFVRPEHRGTGVTEALFAAALDWAWAAGAERVRLIVHEDNARAQAFYRKAGFVPSGVTVRLAQAPGADELEFVLERG
jgi:GNAT superfamily N-acetyltransferase